MNIFLVSIIIAISITAVLGIILKVAFKKKIALYSADNDTKSIKNIKAIKIVVLAMVLIFSFFISLQVISLSSIEKNFVYDLYGNAYSSISDIPLYDEYGNEYFAKVNDDNTRTFYVNKNGDIRDANDVYITTGGYIVFLEENKIKSYVNLYEIIYDNGEHYYAVIYPYWNKNGDLVVDSDDTLFGENNIIITKKEQLAYQKEKGLNLID
ncbi:MAG: hypothetical protein K2G73_08685 [Eubacterium sp.]|nr:hypothetical protein [Eubacterium sp.]